MTRQSIIERTIHIINVLPEEKAEEIGVFADFVYKQYEGQLLSNGIAKLVYESKAFDFLKEEEDIYTDADLKDVYHE